MDGTRGRRRQDGSTHFVAIDHGPAGYVAVGFVDDGPDRDGLIMHSADGTAWKDVSGPVTVGLDIVDVAANDDMYVAIAQASGPARTVLLTSADGRRWVRVPPPDGSVETYGHDIAASPDGFLAAGGDPAVAAAWRSADGADWEALPGDGPASADHGLNSLVATDGGWAALGPNVAAPHILQSSDGRSWFAAAISSDDDVRAYELTIGDTGWYVAGGEGSCGPLSSCPEGPVGWWSVDSRSWILVPSGTTPVRPGAGALVPVGDAGFVWVDGQTAQAGPDPLHLGPHRRARGRNPRRRVRRRRR